MKHLLFVCSYNICRSVAAEAVFRYIASVMEAPLEVSSAGVNASLDDKAQAIDPMLKDLMDQRGYDISQHMPRNLSTYAARDFSHALWLDESQRPLLTAWASEQATELSSLASHSRAYALNEIAVPEDGHSLLAYRIMLDQIEDACLGLWHDCFED